MALLRSGTDSRFSIHTALPELLAGFTIGLFIAYFVNSFRYSGQAITLFMLFLVSLSCIIPLISKRSRGSVIDPFEPSVVFSALTFIFFVFGPIVSILLNDHQIFGLEYLNKDESIRILNITLAFVLLGTVLFYAGYYSRIPQVFAENLPCFKFDGNKERIAIILLLFILFGVGCYFAVLMSHGLPFLSEFRRGHIARTNTKYFLGGMYFFKVALYILFAVYLQQKRSSRFYAVLFLLCFTFDIFSSASLASRSRTFSTFFILAAVYHYARGRIRFSTMVLIGTGLLAVAVIVFPLLKIIYSIKILEGHRFFGADFKTAMAMVFKSQEHMFFDKIQEIAVLIKNVPGKLSIQWGSTLFCFLQSFIPVSGSLHLPLKSEGQLFMSTFFPSEYQHDVSYPITILGVLYLNFYFVGIFGMFVFGMLWRIVYQYLQRNIDNVTTILLYAITIAHLRSFYGGNLTHALKFYISQVGVLIIALLFISGGVLTYKKALR